MLGDGHLEKNGRFARLRIDQSLKHKDYINWLYQELSDIVPSKPRIIQEKDRRTLKVYTRLHFSTYSNGQLDNGFGYLKPNHCFVGLMALCFLC